jgi:hypothetical protein
MDRGIGYGLPALSGDHLVTLLRAGDPEVLHWFTLAVALLLDSAAVLLLLAATRLSRPARRCHRALRALPRSS